MFLVSGDALDKICLAIDAVVYGSVKVLGSSHVFSENSEPSILNICQ